MSQHAPRSRAASSRRRSKSGSAPRAPHASSRGTTAAPRRPVQSTLDRALSATLDVEPISTSFSELGLPAALVAALARRGLESAFPIQARTLPDAIAGRDLLGRAQTGSGKTLAFGLPMLARLAGTAARRRPGAPRGLVLVPTRELARQVAEALSPLSAAVSLRVLTVYGGASIGGQITGLRRGADVVVATPGRLIDLLERGAITLGDVEITVLDEADHMVDLGFLPAVTRILDATPARGQRLLFSATLDRAVEKVVRDYLSDPALHAVASATAPVEATEHRVFVLSAGDKVAVAAEIASRPARTLFFVRTKHGADRLVKQFLGAGVQAAAIHGNLNQNQRQRALAGFSAGVPRVLVATDVAARGIHVDDVDLVVHFDPPADHKDYLHRSGRTARAGATGTVVALVAPEQVAGFARLHDGAGVTPTTDHVHSGHNAVRSIADSGTPLPAPREPSRPQSSPARSGSANRRRRPRPGMSGSQVAAAG